MHITHVAQNCQAFLLLYFVAMSSVKTAGREETEQYKLTGPIFFDEVADRPMSTSRSNT
jgi:hypothetical protein